jgi:adenine phosphoribosyltransferase
MLDKKTIDQNIRKIPNFPKPGILFYDITTLFENKNVWPQMIDDIAKRYQEKNIDKVVGIDARGFLLAGAIGYKLKTGIALVRKPGKLPGQTISASYEKEYGSDEVAMHADTIKPGERILITDDLLATGGTIMAAIHLVEKMQGKIIGIEFIVNLSFLSGAQKLKNKKYNFNYLIDYDHE